VLDTVTQLCGARLSGSDIRLIKMACEQLAYTAVKFSNTNDDRITAHQLANIKGRIDLVGTLPHAESSM
jgi:hypothetical protein